MTSIFKKGNLAMTLAIAYIFVSVLASATGQVVLKQGMNGLGPLTLSFNQLGSVLWRISTNPYVVAGLLIYAAGTLFWLTALSRVELSYAYPFVSLSFVVMLLASWQLFDEHITVMRLVGTFVICVGVLLVSRS